jgi:TolB protein
MTINCSNCGTDFPDEEPFCPRCGKPQLITGTVAPVQDEPAPTRHADPEEGEALGSDFPVHSVESTGRRWTLGRALGGCLLAFGCIVLVFLAIGAVATYQGLQERAALTRQQAEVHYERGLAHLEAGQYEFAIAEFELTLRLDPAHREAREALREAKTTTLAQPTATSATLQEATFAILAEAEALVQDQKWREASQRLSQLRDLVPDFEAQQVSDLLYTAYFNLGTQLVNEGQVDEGVHAFESALTERPGDPEASDELDRASLYASAQATWGVDWPGTIEYLEQLYTLSPEYLDVSAKLFEAYEDYGDDLAAEEAWCLAEQQYEEAATLKPSAAIQDKGNRAARLCRTPTPTPRPAVTAARPSARTATVTATTASTATTGAPSGSVLFSRFNEKNATWEIVSVAPGARAPTVILGDATQPAGSPNGNFLAYHAEVDEAEGIHVINLSTGEDVRVTTFREDVTPDWAPDNLRFVFPSQRSGNRRWQIHIGWVDAKGDPIVLVDGRTPSWSPSGDVIAYQGTDAEGNNPGLYLISPEGGPVARLTQDESDRTPAWSPDCARRRVTVTDGEISTTPATVSSGDGCQIAFMSSHAGDWEIYVIDVLSGSLRRLTRSTGNDGLPTWSPDGEYIAFVSDRDGSWGVYTIPASGGRAVKVADWSEEHADWLVERIDWVR